MYYRIFKIINSSNWNFKYAPADVLTTSELIGAELFCDIIIPETLAANEVLIMAPKFLVSVIPSSKRYVRFSFSLYVFELSPQEI